MPGPLQNCSNSVITYLILLDINIFISYYIFLRGGGINEVKANVSTCSSEEVKYTFLFLTKKGKLTEPISLLNIPDID